MRKNEFYLNNMNNFVHVLVDSGFTKEDFLFHSAPYVEGFFYILRKVNKIIRNGDDRVLNVLDLGCGSGLTSYLLACMGFKVHGIDIYNEKEEIQDVFLRKGKDAQATLWKNLSNDISGKLKANFQGSLKYDFFDGIHIEAPNEVYDMVMAHAVLEHVPNKIRTPLMLELARVLKPGGYFVIARTPNKYSLSEFLVKSHNIRFSEKEIQELVTGAGFGLEYYTKTDFLPEVAPGGLQKVINLINPMYHSFDVVVSYTPFEILSHHHFIVAKKNL